MPLMINADVVNALLHKLAIDAMDALMTVDPGLARDVAASYTQAEDDSKGADYADIMPPDWKRPEEHPGDWYEIRMIIFHRYQDGPMDEEQVARASGCLGYALRQEWRGEDLSGPEIISNSVSATILDYCYDSTKTRSDDPGFHEPWKHARQYIADGTPVRLTNRSGKGTKGTRLVDGIGPNYTVDFYVR